MLTLSLLAFSVKAQIVVNSSALGMIVGTTDSIGSIEAEVFRGIPYASLIDETTGNFARFSSPNLDVDLSAFANYNPAYTFDGDTFPAYVAETFGPSCPNKLDSGTAPLCRTCSTRNGALVSAQDEENCLTLNLMRPTEAPFDFLPIFVFVHGGGGTVGSSASYANTSALVAKGAMVITIQYRLGLLGWFSSPALDAEEAIRSGGASGNQALKDVIGALAWVRKYAEDFGGDPSRITVFGQSFGAAMMQYLLYSPLAQDATGKALFDRMIIESSGWDTSASAFATSASAQMNQLSSIYTSLACTTGDDTDKLACLRGKSWEDTLDLTALNANVSQVMPVIDIAASVDPLFLRPALTGQPFDLITSGAFNKVPLIIGHNEKESRLSEYFTGAQYATIAATYGMNNETATLREKVGDFVKNNVNDVSDLNAAVDELLGFYPLSAGGDFTSNYDVYTAVATDSGVGFGTWALAQEVATQDVPVWNYVFRAAPTDLAEWGAMHLTELAFVFSQPSWFPVETSESTVRALNWTQSDAALADLVQQYWVNFAATANPNTDDNQLTALYGKTALGVDVQWPAFVDSGSTVAQSLLLSSTGPDGAPVASTASDWRADAYTYYAEKNGFAPKVGPGAKGKEGWPAGAIVGLVLGILVVLIIPAAIVALVIVVIQIRRKKAAEIAAGGGPTAKSGLLGGASTASETYNPDLSSA